MRSTVVGLLVLSAACGPTAPGQPPTDPPGDGRDGGGGGDGWPDAGGGPSGPVGTVAGTVWAPGNAPGMVPPGHEIPVAGAVAYIAPERPPAIPDGVYCDPCQAHPAGAVVTDARGAFQLTGVRAGTQRLVIEKAQFRREQLIQVSEELGVTLTAEDTTLPSRHDPDAGLWIPRIALAVGDSDHVEDVLGKMGILEVDGAGVTVAASFDDTDRVVLYGNPVDPPFASHHVGTIAQLFGDVEAMKQFHIILVPCNYESDVWPLTQASVRANIRDYVAAGGKLYVTDWSAEWEDAAFPEFIAFDPAHDTTAAMVAAGTVNPGDGDFGHFAMHASAVDPELAAWLDGQQGPVVVPLGGEELEFPSEYTLGVVQADDFIIEGNWNLIRSLPTVDLGSDADGNPVQETAHVWIDGDYAGQRFPHTVTFEPSCGRVMYSTYHTAQQPHVGLVPQERVLLYLLMQIGVCNDGPVIP